MQLLPMASSPDGLISARYAVITKTPGWGLRGVGGGYMPQNGRSQASFVLLSPGHRSRFAPFKWRVRNRKMPRAPMHCRPSALLHCTLPRVHRTPSAPRQGGIRRGGGGGGLGPKILCTKNGPTRFSNRKFRFLPRWSLWSGGGGVSRSNTSFAPPPHRSDPSGQGRAVLHPRGGAVTAGKRGSAAAHRVMSSRCLLSRACASRRSCSFSRCSSAFRSIRSASSCTWNDHERALGGGGRPPHFPIDRDINEARTCPVPRAHAHALSPRAHRASLCSGHTHACGGLNPAARATRPAVIIIEQGKWYPL